MRVIVVTGAVQGIGRGIAERLAREECFVVVSDLRQVECDRAAREISGNFSAEVIGLACDVSDARSVKKMVARVMQRCGRLDGLVNNAGIFPAKPLEQLSLADWERVIHVNLRGAFLTTQESLRVMQPGSRIVMISSIAARKGFEGLAHYCASKAGVEGFVRAAALELAPRGITINAVAPGAIDTPGATAVLDAKAKRALAKSIPIGRWGAPADIANVVEFLVRAESGYITGQSIVVDGGWTVS